MNRNTQRHKVLEHLQTNGSITSWEAITRFHATRLSGIIFDLKKMGYPIQSTIEYNGDTHYARYTLEAQDDNKTTEVVDGLRGNMAL